jgi:hypothetical protein
MAYRVRYMHLDEIVQRGIAPKKRAVKKKYEKKPLIETNEETEKAIQEYARKKRLRQNRGEEVGDRV